MLPPDGRSCQRLSIGRTKGFSYPAGFSPSDSDPLGSSYITVSRVLAPLRNSSATALPLSGQKNEAERSEQRPLGLRRKEHTFVRTRFIHRPARDSSPPRGGTLSFCLARTVFVGQTHLHRLSLPRPTELSAITPDPMQNGRQPAGERDEQPFPARAAGPPSGGPGFEPGPAAGSGQDDLSRLKQQRSHHGIAAQRDPTDPAAFP